MDVSTLIGMIMAVALIVWGITVEKLGNFLTRRVLRSLSVERSRQSLPAIPSVSLQMCLSI